VLSVFGMSIQASRVLILGPRARKNKCQVQLYWWPSDNQSVMSAKICLIDVWQKGRVQNKTQVGAL